MKEIFAQQNPEKERPEEPTGYPDHSDSPPSDNPDPRTDEGGDSIPNRHVEPDKPWPR